MGLVGCPPILHVGLFDTEGVLRNYVGFLSTRNATGWMAQFELRLYALRLIRLRPQDAAAPVGKARVVGLIRASKPGFGVSNSYGV